MAISNDQFTVSDTPLALNTADEDGMLVILNTDVVVYLGDEKVTAETGFMLRETDPPLYLDLAPNEILYAICGKEKALVTTLRTKNK
jgi:hypothetical protein